VIDVDSQIQDFEVIEVAAGRLTIRLERDFWRTHQDIIKHRFQMLCQTQGLIEFHLHFEPLKVQNGAQKQRRIRKESHLA